MAEQDGAPKGADNPNPEPTAEAGAEEALRAAEGSIEQLKQEESKAPPAAAAAVSDKANAALAAAKAAIEAVKGAQGGATAASPGAASAPASGAMEAARAAMAAASGSQRSGGGAAPVMMGAPVELPSLKPGGGVAAPSELNLIADVNLNVKIELGRTRMLVEDVLRLNEGSVVELDKLAGDPVDVYVNDRHVARGEVLVVNDNFCVRISEILDSEAKEG